MEIYHHRSPTNDLKTITRWFCDANPKKPFNKHLGGRGFQTAWRSCDVTSMDGNIFLFGDKPLPEPMISMGWCIKDVTPVR